VALRRKSPGGAEAVGGGAPDAFGRALDLLARRPHFRAELGRKLLARGFGAEEVDVALCKAADLGYLADETLAASYATELAERRGLGRARIGRELARRGASEAAVEGAVETISEMAELGRARDCAARWARRGAGDTAALARHLDRKGFARHVIFRVLKEFAADAGDLPAADD
jgi:SOS response regulatory protein OraA/RecX